MRNGFKFISLSAVAALSLTALAMQQGHVIKRVAKNGDVAKFRLKADMDFQGQPISFSALVTEKVTKVDADGTYTIDSSTSEGKVDMGGQVMDTGDQGPGGSTTVFKPNGEVVSVTSEQTDPNMYRMANLQSIQFPSKALNVGDTWKVEFKKNDKGVVDAKGDFKVDAQEKIGDYDTYRIHGTLKETTGDQPAGIDATYWVDLASGDLVKMTGTWTNAPFPQPLGAINAKITMTREK